MNYLVIESHPYSRSFNAGVTRALKETAEQKGHTFSSINLVSDAFDPVMNAVDLALWIHGRSDPFVRKYQDMINKADILVFPFPIWWGTMPAVLKGFCDKVLLPGWAYKSDEDGNMVGLLTGKKAIVITTMQMPTEVYTSQFMDPINGGFIVGTLQFCGIETIKYIQIDNISTGGTDYAESKMDEIRALI